MVEYIPLFVPSKTRYQLELENKPKDKREKLKKLFMYDPDFQKIYKKHLLHTKNITRIKKEIGEEHTIDRSLLLEKLEEYDMIVILGGDNHFSYCCQVILDYLKNNPESEKFVVGVLSDKKRSAGVLLKYTVTSFLNDLPKIRKGDFSLEFWTTLATTVYKEQTDGTKDYQKCPPPALCDLFIGEEKRTQMSRSRVYKLKKGEELTSDAKIMLHEKSSGIVIATGAGAKEGSWYYNIHKSLFGNGEIFSNEKEIAKAVVSELYDFKLKGQEYSEKCKVEINTDEFLLIKSLNDDHGIISPSSHIDQQVPFNLGTTAEISISTIKLPIVCPKKEGNSS